MGFCTLGAIGMAFYRFPKCFRGFWEGLEWGGFGRVFDARGSRDKLLRRALGTNCLTGQQCIELQTIHVHVVPERELHGLRVGDEGEKIICLMYLMLLGKQRLGS